MKRFFLLTTTLLCLCVTQVRAYDFVVDGIYYNKLTTNTVAVTYKEFDFQSYSGSITIPSTVAYNGVTYSVTSIGGSAFKNCSGLTSITIPNSVTSIGAWAFDGCSGLTSVTIPNSVTSIGALAFFVCSGLTSVTIPNSVTSIGQSAFGGCSSLTSVTIPNSVTSIGSSAFDGCTSLTSVNIPNSLTYIGEQAFNRCTSLTSVNIPNSVTSIGSYAFSGCSGLTSVIIPNSLTYIGELAFNRCTSLTSVNIPSSVTSIGVAAFGGCSSLTSVTIPNSVTSIGSSAFYGCSGLTSLTIGSSVTSIGSNAFNGCSGLTSVIIPESVTSIGDGAFYGCSGLTSVTIPNSVTSIGEVAFKYCSGLTSVVAEMETPFAFGSDAFSSIGSSCTLTVPYGTRDAYIAAGWTGNVFKGGVVEASKNIDFADANVKALCVANWDTNGDGELSETEAAAVTDLGMVFKQNTSITSFDELQYFTGLTNIEQHAFAGCHGLTSVTIPESVTSIGKGAFNTCSGLTSVTIPESVTSIGEDAFKYCSGLTSVIIPESVTSIGTSAFYDCGLTSVTIPNSVTSIGEYAFSYCSGLTSVIIPESVTSIGECAFNGCSSLSSVTIPESVTSIGNLTFEGCISLTSVTIPKGVTSIGDGAFSDCSGLASVTLLEGVKRIGSSAFYNCSSLTSVTLPNSVTSIGSSAFADCSSLSSVVAKMETPFRSFAFSNIGSSCVLTVPYGTRDAYIAAGWTENKFKGGVVEASKNIVFADANVKALCVANWDTNGDGELSEAEAAAVTDLGEVFNGNKTIQTFDELQYFTGLTSIGYIAFESCSGLTSVTIPNSVTSIGYRAFAGCKSLNYINIPSSVTSIERQAFAACNAIQQMVVEDNNPVYDSRNGCNAIIETSSNTLISGTVTSIIPESVKSIGNSAFLCISLSSITIPNGVMRIGEGAFNGCSSLTSVTIPESVISIGDYAFGGSGLTSVTIPSSVTEIGENPFNYCTSLQQIIVNPNNRVYDSREECNAIIKTSSNTLIVGCQNTTITNSVANIGSFAFWGCSDLTSITIPESVTSIGDYAFDDCSGLTSVVTEMETPFAFGSDAFENIGSSCVLTVPYGTRDAYIAAAWTEDVFKGGIVESPAPVVLATSVTINEETLSLTTVGETATLTAEVLPENVTDGSVTWSSSDESVATVSSDGVVTAVANGTATITATSNDGSNLSATCTVTVDIPTVEPDTDISGLDNVIYMERTEAIVGTEQTLSVKMKNTDGIQTVQFDLYLPDGVEVVLDDDGYEQIELGLERTTARKMDQFSVVRTSNGAYRVLINSTRGNTFDGNDGEIVTARVKLADDMAAGDYPLIFKDIVLVNTSSVGYRTEYVKCTLSVDDYIPGDVNNDKAVDAIDLNAITNYILERRTFPFTFNVKAGDVNGDSVIDAIDLNAVTNMILHDSQAGAKPRAVVVGRIDNE